MSANRAIRCFSVALTAWIIICAVALPSAARAEFNLEDMLKRSTEELMDMELASLLDMEIASAGKMVEKVAEIPASVLVITREEIERNGWRTLIEILRNTPGFYHVYDFDDDSVGVRGTLSSNNMVLLFNGVTQMDNHIESLAVSADQIDRIEIVRGPMSVIHGSGAFLGSINIVTNHIPYGAPLGMASASYGSDATYSGLVRKSGETRWADYTVNASVWGTHGLDEDWSDHWDLSFLEEYGLSDFSTGGRMERKNANFNLSLTGTSGFYGDLQYNHRKDGILDSIDVFYSGNPSLEEDNILAARIGWRGELGSAWTLDMQMLYGHSEYSRYDDYGYFEDGSKVYRDSDGSDNRVEVELDLVWRPADWFNMLAGIKYKTEFDGSYDGEFSGFDFTGLYGTGMTEDDLFLQGSYDIGDREVRSIFTQANLWPFSCLKLVAGIRAEQYMAFDTNLRFFTDRGSSGIAPVIERFNEDEKVYYIPRAAAVYSLSEHQFLKFMYGKANKPYSVNNLEIGVQRRDLEPEEIETLELVYLLDMGPLNFSLSLFRNDIDKLIGYTFEETDQGYDYFIANGDRKVTEGAEVILGYHLLKGLDVQFSLTWQDTEAKSSKILGSAYIFASPEYLAKCRVAYTWKRFTAALSASYVDEMLRFSLPVMNGYTDDAAVEDGGDGPPADDDLSGPPDLTATMNSCVTVDFNLRYEDEETGFFSAFRVNNLLDEDIYYPTLAEHMDSYNGFPAAGRQFTFTMGWKF